MKYISETYTWIIGIIGFLSSFITGHTDEITRVLICLMVMDVITGLMKGFNNKRLKSSIMHMGIMKKTSLLLSIIFAYFLDTIINSGIPIFKTLMCWLAIGNEGLSIVENLVALGVFIPASIRNSLAHVIKEKIELQKEKDGDQD